MLLRNETSTPSADMAAPRGRPPAGHRYVDGVFVHAETGIPFDPELHAGLAHAKKLACLRALSIATVPMPFVKEMTTPWNNAICNHYPGL